MHERVLAIRKKAHGPSHILVAETLRELASLLFRKGNLEEASVRLERAIVTGANY